jgi:hypothetical protein
MDDRWRFVAATAIVLALPIGGCQPAGRPDLLPVGTCVRASDRGETVVPCIEPHTHRVTAIVAGDGDACPRDTVMYASPADPDDGQWTICYQADAAAE